jgi:hypothetical protein
VNHSPGIYVEILIEDELDRVWHLTQEPALHQRWDLRFSEIQYLPRPSVDLPQQFLYETRVGFGLSVKGTGESVGQRADEEGDATSALKFASDDPKSLIREGSGYWRYVATPAGLRFFTWYDYTVRFGVVGRVVDRVVFRPLMGWATAWSFDRLRLWTEKGQTPEASLAFSAIDGTARISIAAVWIWHGLVPKLIYRHADERAMLAQAGVSISLLPALGISEVLLGVAILCTWRRREVYIANIALMIAALVAVALNSSAYLQAAFNPVSLNFAVIALSVVGWIASGRVPSSRFCRRSAPKG